VVASCHPRPGLTGEIIMEKAIVKINEKEFEIKFTLGFWKKVQEACDVTQPNLEEKLNENFGLIASSIIYYGIWYGINPRISTPDEMPVTMDDIEQNLDKSVVDVIEAAVINGMSKQEKRLVDLARKKQEADFVNAEEEVESGKKKLQVSSTDS